MNLQVCPCARWPERKPGISIVDSPWKIISFLTKPLRMWSMGTQTNPSHRHNSATASLTRQDEMKWPLAWTAIRHVHVPVACSLDRTFQNECLWAFTSEPGATVWSAVVHRITLFDTSWGTVCSRTLGGSIGNRPIWQWCRVQTSLNCCEGDSLRGFVSFLSVYI